MSKLISKHKVDDMTKVPIKIKLNRAFSLPIRMPGHLSAVVMVQLREGQLIDDTALIQLLLKNQAPVPVTKKQRNELAQTLLSIVQLQGLIRFHRII